MAHQTVSRVFDDDLVPTEAGATAAPSADCPVEVALAAVSRRWTTLILRDLLSEGPLSYSALARRLPALSDKVLSERLDTLVAESLVTRHRTSGFPSRTEYSISSRGELLRPLLVQLYATGEALARHDDAES